MEHAGAVLIIQGRGRDDVAIEQMSKRRSYDSPHVVRQEFSTMRLAIMIRYWFLGFCVVILAVACGSTATEPENDLRCPMPGGEFASYGCAVVAGVVRDANGHGMPAATVTVTGSSECGACFGITTVAAKDGSFELVLQRYAPPPGVPMRDSVPATVRALATGGYPRPPDNTYYTDSTSTILVFSPVGSSARKSKVVLTIHFQ